MDLQKGSWFALALSAGFSAALFASGCRSSLEDCGGDVGCACVDDDECLGALSCIGGLCVDDSEDESGDTQADSESTSEASTGGDGDSGSTGGDGDTSGGDGDTTGGDGDTTGGDGDTMGGDGDTTGGDGDTTGGDGDTGSSECDGVPSWMVCVPAGSFEMGSDTAADELPIRTVDMPTYYIDQQEVSVSSYGTCVMAGDCTNPNTASGCNWGVGGLELHPVNCVTWDQAVDYCTWIGSRLPTEAEWEKAARGTDARTYPWGEETATCTYAHMHDEAYGNGAFGCDSDGTAPVGSYSPGGDSVYGAQDMAGNVLEWTADWWSDQGYDANDLDNPQGNADGTYRALRGGSWEWTAENLRTANRSAELPNEPLYLAGFRCARDAN